MTNTDKQLVLLVLGAAFLYLVWNKVKKPLDTLTAPATDVLAWWWTLDDPPGVGNVLGNVLLPDNSLVPLSTVALKTDAQHNVYANIAGSIYELHPSDANGNYPATLVGS